MGKLTPLQRLGISHLLVNYRFHGNQFFESGTIVFRYNERAKLYNVYVKIHQREVTIQFTLKECENIDCTQEYYCRYDYEEIMFVIEDINEKVVES